MLLPRRHDTASLTRYRDISYPSTVLIYRDLIIITYHLWEDRTVWHRGHDLAVWHFFFSSWLSIHKQGFLSTWHPAVSLRLSLSKRQCLQSWFSFLFSFLWKISRMNCLNGGGNVCPVVLRDTARLGVPQDDFHCVQSATSALLLILRTSDTLIRYRYCHNIESRCYSQCRY